MIQDNKKVPRSLTYEKVYTFVLELFQYDRDKTNAFWMNKLPELDNKSPYEMVKEGKARKLMRVMEKCGI
jgi:hypothetical protein